MKNKDDIRLLFDWYHIEFNKKNELDNALNVPILILSGIIAAIFFLFTTFKEAGICPFKISSILFYLAITLSFLFCIISIIHLIYSYSTSLFNKELTYISLPSATGIKNRYDTISKGLKKQDSEITEEEIESYVNLDLINELTECIDENIRINEYRYEKLFKSKVPLIYSSIFVMSAFLLYIVSIYF